ncbi:MAG: lysophospholipase [Clostridia bacterium]|nr:lysophospholipase [Deltaproteobacteria bacterium]
MTANRTQLSFTSADGTPLSAHRWSPEGSAKAALLVIHGYADHAERYREIAIAMADLGIDTTAVDMRGHGRSAGQRGYINAFSEYHADVEAARTAMASGELPFFVLGHSNGGLIALDWVSQNHPQLRGLVVTNPYVARGMHVPLVKLAAGHVLGRLVPHLSIPSGIDPAGLTHETKFVEAYRRDPQVFTTASAGWFREATRAQYRVMHLRNLESPLFYVHSDSDPIASPSANAELAAKLKSPDKTILVRRGELHEVLNETDRKGLFQQIGSWILKRS